MECLLWFQSNCKAGKLTKRKKGNVKGPVIVSKDGEKQEKEPEQEKRNTKTKKINGEKGGQRCLILQRDGQRGGGFGKTKESPSSGTFR